MRAAKERSVLIGEQGHWLVEARVPTQSVWLGRNPEAQDGGHLQLGTRSPTVEITRKDRLRKQLSQIISGCIR